MIDQIQTEKKLYEIINATVSHEMRNPINSIEFQGRNIEFLLKQVNIFFIALDETPELKKIKKKASEMTRSLSVMRQSSKLLLFFVQDLLDFAQIKQKKFTKHLEMFDVQSAVDEICQLLAFQSTSS